MAYEIYVDEIDRDEMRSGFLVTVDRKKLWNVQLNLIVEFARICKKYDLKWYAYGGTLLGAVRHKGFIPWDDDVDLCMFRPDYEKFKRVVSKELKPEFFLELWYNYAWEGDPNPNNYPTITREQLKKYPWIPIASLLRLRDNRTTYLRYPEYDNLIQSIWLDVFPLDPVPPFDTPEQEEIFERGHELGLAVTYPEYVAKQLEAGEKFFLPRERLKELISLPYRERALEYENYLASNWFESKYACFRTFRTTPEGPVKRYFSLSRNAYDAEVELPFERLVLPAPAGYEQLLKERYGEDWRVPKKMHTHAKIYSADVSYKDYFRLRED